jgi:hypothetical protein
MSLRVALIGNMNNNHFVAMRHMRDAGVDAHLFMFSDELTHFYPQNDTWDWERWRPFVHQLHITNGGLDALLARGAPLRAQLDGFDAYLGNGFSPVMFAKMGRKLDLFVPYAEGVEFIIHHAWNWRRPHSTAFSLVRKAMMERAMKRNVKAIGTANLHEHSLDTFRRLKLQPLHLPVITLYREEPPVDAPMPAAVPALLARMRASRLVVFSHVSHIWKTLPVPHFMGGVGKRNQWLIEGFAGFRRGPRGEGALLCLFEYGPDVDNSKALIRELGIEADVIWFPKMSRREIANVLRFVHVGASEFAGMFWGGCGWEFMGNGIPMIHQLDDVQDYAARGESLPPFFNVFSAADIERVLTDTDAATFQRVGREARAWCDLHNGTALAKRYIDLLDNLRKQAA